MRFKSILALLMVIFMSNCSIASKLAGKSDKELADMDEADITSYINIYRGFNRCSSDDVQRLKREIIRRHPKWDDKAIQAVLNCDIYVGMYADQVAAAWGSPEIKPHQATTVWTTFEIWDYSTANKRIKLKFENKKLAEINYEK